MTAISLQLMMRTDRKVRTTDPASELEDTVSDPEPANDTTPTERLPATGTE
jgi:hypothetical protein